MANFKARELRGPLQGLRVAWPTSRPASCVADVRPVQAVTERKHERKGAGRCRSRGGAGRTSSACPHYTALKEEQLNDQHPAHVVARAACAHHHANFCFKRMSLAA